MVIITRRGRRSVEKLEREAEEKAAWEAGKYAEVCEVLGDRLSAERVASAYDCFLSFHRNAAGLPERALGTGRA